MNVREWALPVYSVLMQIAVGALFILWVIRILNHSKLAKEEMDRMIANPLTIIFLTIVFAVIGAHFHLSRPYLSLFAVLNFRTSWLSREIVFTILFFLTVGSTWGLQRLRPGNRSLKYTLGWIAILFGFATVYCMSRIYLLPTQVAWNSPATIISFFGTTLLLGAMAMAALMSMDLRFAEVRESEIPNIRITIIQRSLVWLALVAAIMVILVIALNTYQISSLRNMGEPAQTSLDLLLGLYRPLFGMQLGLLIAGVGWLVLCVYLINRKRKTIQELMGPIYTSCMLVMVGEILGRFLFYATHVRIGV